MKTFIVKSFLFSTLILLIFSLPVNAKLKVGEVLHYKVTFGNIFKGNAEIKFYGKITSYTFSETLTVSIDELIDEAGYSIISDSIANELKNDSLHKEDEDSNGENSIDSVQVLKTETIDIYYIAYDTKFIGNVYNLHADIYTNDNFFPLFIETRIQRTGGISHGKEYFFPEKSMAIFSQVIGNEKEVDTLQRENQLQDVTTIPFYFMDRNVEIGSSFSVSLPQGEFTLTSVKTENIEIGEDFEHRVYNTYKIKSEPEGYSLWLTKGEKLPVKVHMDEQKIKMLLKKREIDPLIKSKVFNEKEVKEKLIHLYPNQ